MVQRLYLFELTIDNEKIIKCGKSSGSSSRKRLASISEDYLKHNGKEMFRAKIIRDVECSDVFRKESDFHHKFRSRRFIPSIKFSGYTELFRISKEEAMIYFDTIIGRDEDRSAMKICTKCKIEKSTINYHINKNQKTGLNPMCKQCVMEGQRSKIRIHTRIYNNQITHSRSRHHPLPLYTCKQLKEWLHSQKKFHELYEDYKKSGYNKSMVPSVDRIKDELPYTFNNIQLMSFSDNCKKNNRSQKDRNSRNIIIVHVYYGDILYICDSLSEAILMSGQNSKTVYDSKISKLNSYGKLKSVYEFGFIYSEDKDKFITNGSLNKEYRRIATPAKKLMLKKDEDRLNNDQEDIVVKIGFEKLDKKYTAIDGEIDNVESIDCDKDIEDMNDIEPEVMI